MSHRVIQGCGDVGLTARSMSNGAFGFDIGQRGLNRMDGSRGGIAAEILSCLSFDLWTGERTAVN